MIRSACPSRQGVDLTGNILENYKTKIDIGKEGGKIRSRETSCRVLNEKSFKKRNIWTFTFETEAGETVYLSKIKKF